MLILEGYPLCGRTIRHSFNSPQPLSNSLGDACLGRTSSTALTLTRRSGLATVTCRLRAAPAWYVALVLCGRVILLLC